MKHHIPVGGIWCFFDEALEAIRKIMMAAFEGNTGQAQPNTGVNTEAPEIEGWKRGQGKTTSSVTQGGKDTLEFEGARDAEAKGFATMIEAPKADNKVTATTGDTKTNLQDMEGGSGTTVIGSGKMNRNNTSIDLDADTFKRIRDMERGTRPDPF